MSSRLSALLVWALVTASVVFWALRLSASPLPVPDGALLASQPHLASGDLSPLLGKSAPAPTATVAESPPPQASRFRLTGVVAIATDRRQGSRSSPGVALISVDGSPPKAFRVGDVVASNLALHSVALRSASIEDRSAAGSIAFVLELPPPAAAATGRPPVAVNSIPGSPGAAAFHESSEKALGAIAQSQGISDQAAAPNFGGMAPSIQMVPGVDVQSMPPGVQLQPPSSKRSDDQAPMRPSMRQ